MVHDLAGVVYFPRKFKTKGFQLAVLATESLMGSHLSLIPAA
jgi:hypothetical protein